MEECKDNRRRTNHTVLERQRRSEQRTLFDKLQSVLPSDPRAPRLRLLTLVSALMGHKLQETNCFLFEYKFLKASKLEKKIFVHFLSNDSRKIQTKNRNVSETVSK